MSQKTDLINVARTQLGIKESPSGSNKVKYTSWYGMIGPWCAMFVSWCANKAGIPTSVIPKHAYTPSGKAWFKNRGQWGTKPVVGAIAYYNLSGLGRVSHVGIVIKVYSDGSFDAIEGNTDATGGRTGGKVMVKRRKSMGSGGGFGYPKYDNKSTMPKGGSSTTSDDGYTTVKYGQILRKGTKGAPVKEWQTKALGYTGSNADGYFGADTEKDTIALQKKFGVTADGEVGPKTWPLRLKVTPAKPATKPTSAGKAPGFPLPKGHYFGPKSGPDESHSGYYNNREHLRVWQKQMAKRGWKITTDGLYGPATGTVVKQFQKEKGLQADGLIGAETWAAAWTEKVT